MTEYEYASTDNDYGSSPTEQLYATKEEADMKDNLWESLPPLHD